MNGALMSYIADFSRLSLQVSKLDELSPELRFVKGLRPGIKRHVLSDYPTTLDQALRLAQKENQPLRFTGNQKDETEYRRPNLPSLHARNATQYHVSNISVKSSNEHELLPVEDKVNGRRAVMLIDSDSTHDFIAEGFVRQYQLLNDVSGGKDLLVTLSDGSFKSHRVEAT